VDHRPGQVFAGARGQGTPHHEYIVAEAGADSPERHQCTFGCSAIAPQAARSLVLPEPLPKHAKCEIMHAKGSSLARRTH
jgi:hypothetical protein